MKIKKQHMVLATLVLILSAAVYINWRTTDVTEVKDVTTKELGAATYVNSDLSSFDEISIADNSSLSEDQIEYFAECKNERSRTQDEMIALAKEVLELADCDEDSKEEAAEQLSYLENIILSQSRIEATLKAKGFTCCLCYLDESGCTVIIPENEMSDNSSLIIRDCVNQCSGLSFENISIIEI